MYKCICFFFFPFSSYFSAFLSLITIRPTHAKLEPLLPVNHATITRSLIIFPVPIFSQLQFQEEFFSFYSFNTQYEH